MMVLDALLITSTSLCTVSDSDGFQDGNGMLDAETASWLELRGAGGRQVRPASSVDRKCVSEWAKPRVVGSARQGDASRHS